MSKDEIYVPESFRMIEESLEKSMTTYQRDLSDRINKMMVDQAKYGGWPKEKIDLECKKIAAELVAKHFDRSPNDK